MKMATFNTYNEAIRAAANALKDGFNTAIHECRWGEATMFVNEYFVRDNEREIHE